MEINGKTRTCGLIGDPVEHTLSPLIHNTLAKLLGHDLVYVPFLTKGGEAEVEKAVQGAHALNILGLNVTVPHKEHVMSALTEIDKLAEQIGAVNTLVRTAHGYKGYNTDMTGLYRAMRSEGIQIKGEEIVLLGAGGAARAVAYMLCSYGAQRVYLLNRTFDKAERIAQEVHQALGRTCIVPMRTEEHDKLPSGEYLAIQGTSVGLFPNCEEVIIEDSTFYQRIHTGYDLIYRPSNTKFMRLVSQAGGKAYHGLKMLLYQGIDAYELWNDVTVSEKLAEAVYQRMKKELEIDE